MTACLPEFDFAPFGLSGVVVGALLNHAPALAALGDAVNHPPYKGPPRAPVLQVKPRNTLAGDGAVLALPPGVEALEIGASLGIVIGRTACRVAADDALDHVAGYTIVADISVPPDHPEGTEGSHYRPGVRLRARDGFCPIGPRVVPAAEVAAPDALAVQVVVDGHMAQHTDTGQRVRSVARLIADISEFMTLQPGDLLLLGASADAPRAGAGQAVAIDIAGLGRLQLRVGAASEGARR